MLVSVTLVVLMMLMFAEIYQMAGNIMGESKGLAENDQRVRTMTILLRGDVKSRTFRYVVPFAAGEPAPGADDLAFTNRQGYFYISENDTRNGVDDILQFTVKVEEGSEYPFFGKAILIEGTDESELNQPEADDGQFELEPDGTPPDPDLTIFKNNTGASRWIEVTYFVRNGNLYRRALLLRDRYDNPAPAASAQPNGPGGTPYADDYPPTGSTSTNSFWNDFDYAARYFSSLQFIGRTDLDNTAGVTQFPLGKPINRFGFDATTGNPREYANAANVNTFFGRYTHEETSHPDFHYPGQNPDADGDPANGDENNPMSRNMAVTLVGGVIDEFRGGPRRGEDLLLSNVHVFDVKVWDEVLLEFVDVGHNRDDVGDGSGNAIGDFNQAFNAHRNATPAINYGPRDSTNGGQNRIYDTWHPDFDAAGGDAMTTQDPPPFRPMGPGPDMQPGVAGVDDDGNGTIDDSSELGSPGSDDAPKPLKAIQIQIVFYDVSSEQMRQLTLQIPLTK